MIEYLFLSFFFVIGEFIYFAYRYNVDKSSEGYERLVVSFSALVISLALVSVNLLYYAKLLYPNIPPQFWNLNTTLSFGQNFTETGVKLYNSYSRWAFFLAIVNCIVSFATLVAIILSLLTGPIAPVIWIILGVLNLIFGIPQGLAVAGIYISQLMVAVGEVISTIAGISTLYMPLIFVFGCAMLPSSNLRRLGKTLIVVSIVFTLAFPAVVNSLASEYEFNENIPDPPHLYSSGVLIVEVKNRVITGDLTNKTGEWLYGNFSWREYKAPPGVTVEFTQYSIPRKFRRVVGQKRLLVEFADEYGVGNLIHNFVLFTPDAENSYWYITDGFHIYEIHNLTKPVKVLPFNGTIQFPWIVLGNFTQLVLYPTSSYGENGTLVFFKGEGKLGWVDWEQGWFVSDMSLNPEDNSIGSLELAAVLDPNNPLIQNIVVNETDVVKVDNETVAINSTYIQLEVKGLLAPDPVIMVENGLYEVELENGTKVVVESIPEVVIDTTSAIRFEVNSSYQAFLNFINNTFVKMGKASIVEHDEAHSTVFFNISIFNFTFSNYVHLWNVEEVDQNWGICWEPQRVRVSVKYYGRVLKPAVVKVRAQGCYLFTCVWSWNCTPSFEEPYCPEYNMNYNASWFIFNEYDDLWQFYDPESSIMNELTILLGDHGRIYGFALSLAAVLVALLMATDFFAGLIGGVSITGSLAFPFIKSTKFYSAIESVFWTASAGLFSLIFKIKPPAQASGALASDTARLGEIAKVVAEAKRQAEKISKLRRFAEKVLEKTGDALKKVEDKRFIGRFARVGVRSVEFAEKAIDYSAPYLSSAWSKTKTLVRISRMKTIPAVLYTGYKVLDWMAEKRGSPELASTAAKLAKASFLLQVLKPLDLAIIVGSIGAKKGLEIYKAGQIPNLLRTARREAFEKGYPEIADLIQGGRIWRATHKAWIMGVEDELKSFKLLEKKVDKLVRRIDAEVFKFIDEGVLDAKKLHVLAGQISVVDGELAKKVREVAETGKTKSYLIYRAKDEILRWAVTGKFSPSVIDYALKVFDEHTKAYILGYKEGAFSADFEKTVNLAKKGLSWCTVDEFTYWRGVVDALAGLHPKTMVEVRGRQLKIEELIEWYSPTLKNFDFFINVSEKIEQVPTKVAVFRVAEKPELKIVLREVGWFEKLLMEGQEKAWDKLFADSTWRMIYYYREAEKISQPEIYHEVEVIKHKKAKEVFHELERLGGFLEKWMMPDMQIEDAIRKLGELTVYAEWLNDSELREKVGDKIDEYEYILKGYPLKTCEAEEDIRYGLEWIELYMPVIAFREVSPPIEEASDRTIADAAIKFDEYAGYMIRENSEIDEFFEKAQSILEDMGASHMPEPGMSLALRDMARSDVEEKLGGMYEIEDICRNGLWRCDEALIVADEARRYAEIMGDEEKVKAVEEFKAQLMAKRHFFEELLKWTEAWIGYLEDLLEGMK